MLLTCPACGARYDIPASALPATGRVVRCSACRAEWLARPHPAVGPAVSPPAPREVPRPADVAPAPSDADVEAAAEDAETEAPLVRDPVPASPEQAAHSLALSIEDGPRARSGVGFLAGFATVTLIVLLGVTVYLKRPEIAEALPAARQPLEAYAAVVDQGRAAIERLAGRIRP